MDDEIKRIRVSQTLKLFSLSEGQELCLQLKARYCR